MIRRLAHVCLFTDQLDVLKDFYTRQLGLPLKFAFKNSDGETLGYYVECGAMSFIEIFDRKLRCRQLGCPPALLKPGTQMNHLCLEVTALKEFVATLTARGVKVENCRVGMENSLLAWTADPDGNAIEFIEYTPQSWELRGNETAQAVN